MKKMTKKLFAVIFTLLMTMALGLGALAADTAHLAVQPKDGSTFAAYQVMTATKAGEDADGNALYEYKVNDDFKDFFNNDPYGLNSDNEIVMGGDVIVSDGRNVNTNATKLAEMATALKNYAAAKNIASTALDADLPIGYYLVVENSTSAKNVIASKPILVDLRENTEVIPKDDKVGLEKKIVEGEKKVDANNVSIGDVIEYEVTSNIPTYEANVIKEKLTFTFTDTFSKGITYNKDVKVFIGTEEITTGFAHTPTEDGFKLALDADTILSYQGKDITLKYTGTLNVNAEVDSKDGNPNKIVLEYTNNPNQDKSTDTLEDEVITYTYAFKLHKVDKNDETKDMSGAKFTIKDANGEVIGTFTYNKDGDVVGDGRIVVIDGNYAEIRGLDAGTYTITEDKAPDGYALLGGEVKVTITDEGEDNGGEPNGLGSITVEGQGSEESTIEYDNGDNNIELIVKVVNTKGISLPETGAMTMIYCLAGGALMILLGGCYFTLTRKCRR
ncbi:MAG: isopeptide-forming domain-containing fimbrial protein [Eubacteriales bacterium]|nr:isopeptide-forming domain-containing fimbrial protein [Eubacteriales bacterium]